MEIPRHWRMTGHRLRLEGFVRENGNGPEVSLDGQRGWQPLNRSNGNGHNETEHPTKAQITSQRLKEITVID